MHSFAALDFETANNHHNTLTDAEACANIALKLPVTFE